MTSSVLAIEILAGQRDQLAGTTCELMMHWNGDPPPSHLRWRLTSGDRTLGVGHSQLLQAKQNEEQPIFVLPFETPELSPGVSLTTILHLESSEQLKLMSVPIRVWHRDPFVESKLEGIQITFVDPTGTLKDRLQGLSLTSRFVTGTSDVYDAEYVVVAAEAEWNDRLADAVRDWTRDGANVLVLRGYNARSFSLGWSSDELANMCFSQIADSRWIAKESDQDFWRRDSQRAALKMEISSRSQFLAPFDSSVVHPTDLTRWQIAEFQLRSGGFCLFLGVSLFDQWESSASPRLLLKQILEQFNIQSTNEHR